MKQTIQPYTLVSNHDELIIEAERLLKEPAVGVDLEADSLFHYREKICLLQISARDYNLLIDPLSIKDLSPLSQLFKDKGILKVFHGADYDIRSLYRDFNIKVNNMFDTQLAARFLGITEISLANLLKNTFNISLEKKYQKRDWSKRPISENMLAYAVQDTCHLLDLYDVLEEQLHETGRFSWVLEECELLSKVRPAPSNNNPLFIRFKGAGKLSPLELLLLETVLALREEIAEKKDRPPFKVMNNEQIMKIVQSNPSETMELKPLSHGQRRLLGRELRNRLEAAIKAPQDELPEFPKTRSNPVETTVSDRIKIIKEWRQKYAYKTGLDISVICTNYQIQSLAAIPSPTPRELRKNQILKKWQTDLYGDEICALLDSVK